MVVDRFVAGSPKEAQRDIFGEQQSHRILFTFASSDTITL
jgi:hypothetical protein